MTARSEDGEKYDGSKVETGEGLTIKTRCKILMTKKCAYTLRIDHSGAESVKKCSVLKVFKCLQDAVFKMSQLEFRFQNLPFSKPAGKNCFLV